MDLIVENVGRRSDTWSEEGAPTDVGDASLNGYERNAMFWNRGDGQFVDVGYSTGSNRIEDGRGVAVADFDRDGRLDLVVQNLDRPAVLLMGAGKVGHWLQIELEGTRSNRDAVGAVAMLRMGESRQVRQVAAGTGYLASSSQVLHFGLGSGEVVDELEIRWPSGHRQRFEGLAVNQRLVISETEREAAGETHFEKTPTVGSAQLADRDRLSDRH
jgi:hypothetical protein